MNALPVAAAAPAVPHATPQPPPAHDAGAAAGGGGFDLGGMFDFKKIFSLKTLLFAGIGAAAGAFVPVIPGGPIGGALMGVSLSMFL